MKILFLHGWQSIPGGVKPTYLAQHGHTVINPKLPDDDFAAALAIAQAAFDNHQPDVIVGSSRGGALAMNLNVGNIPLVLLCPAWKKYDSETTIRANSTILHSRADDVVPFADSEELSKVSGATLIEVGSDHRLANPESLGTMLKACEDRPPIFCGIDISSDTLKCAIAIGEASFGVAGIPSLTVTLREPTDQGDNDWNLPSVAGVIAELVARCRSEKRKAVVAVDIPFGYPNAFAQYLKCHPLEAKHHTDQLPLVDDLLFRGSERQLKHSLLSPVSWTTNASRLPLWRYYQSLRTAYFSESDPKTTKPRNMDGSVKKSNCFPTSPLCTVADKIGRAIARWVRVACEVGARSVGPSLWKVQEDVYLFECYPLASLVSSGLWHPDLKGSERGPTTRAAVVNLLRSHTIRLAGTSDERADRDCKACWGNVQVGDVTASDHAFDAFVCTCTAWWCGSSILSRYGVPGCSSYPKPPLAQVSDQCFTDPTGGALDEAEGGIYYPRTPECLLDR